ncbi:MAG: ABC transporter ATP-binding protein [Lachnospiraceae bacterium]|nr:ABC transporter ATP-binding protein [Lachnospiraceae bacterium]
MNMFSYLKAYKKESILGPLFKLLEASIDLIVPLVVAAIIDVGVANNDRGYIFRMGGLMIALGVIGLALAAIAQYFAAKAATGYATAVRLDLFRKINQLSYNELDRIGTSTLITRITSDINQVQSGLNLGLRLLLRSPFIVFGSMIMAFHVNRAAAMIFVVVIPALAIVVYGVMFITMPYYKKIQQKLDLVTLKVRENLVGVRVIRAFNRQEEEKKQFDEASTDLVRTQVFAGRISGIMNPLTYVIINAGLIAVVWIGGKEVDTGIISQGEVIALVNYMSQILVELVKLANLIVSISKAMACAGRIRGILETKTSIKREAIPVPEPVDESVKVAFEQVSFTYGKAKKESLLGIDFRAKPGQTIGVIGGTGSGKSSLVNLIPRFYDVTSGAVLVDGVNVKDYPLDALRAKVGIVPQRAVLFAGTIRENMQWGKKDATDEEIQEALATAQAKEFVDQMEDGLDTKILQGGKNLSGGQRQRLTIARALVRKPEILILDDSASALDFATDARLRLALRDMAKNLNDKMTVFLVSQRASTIRDADQILVLDDGALVGVGTHKELLKSCEVYREICLSQLTKEEVERDAK